MALVRYGGNDPRWKAPYISMEEGHGYCNLCWAWAVDGHLTSTAHHNRVANYEMDAKLAEEWSLIPYYERRDDHWYCHMCSAVADTKHCTSNKHLKNEDWAKSVSREEVEAFYARGQQQRPQLALMPPTYATPSTTTTAMVPYERNYQWMVYQNEDGRPYYHNEVTGLVTWDRPLELPVPTVAQAVAPDPADEDEDQEEELPEGWTRHLSEQYGIYYYHEVRTGRTDWWPPKVPNVSVNHMGHAQSNGAEEGSTSTSASSSSTGREYDEKNTANKYETKAEDKKNISEDIVEV